MKKLIYLFLLSTLFACSSSKQLNLQTNVFVADFANGFSENWYAENHTFANNLAHFDSENVSWAPKQVRLSLLAKPKNEKEYTGAELRTKKLFKYGTFEVEMRASDALGVITAFFLYQSEAEKNSEIDIEISGKYPKVITTNHWIDHQSNDYDINVEFDTSKAFHTYTIIWHPKQIIWKVDGKIIHQTQKAIPQQAMQVIFNLWATKSIKWAGDIKDGKLPTFAYFKSFKYYPYR